MRKLTLELVKQIAKDKDGECLSKKYNGCFSKLKFKCNKDGYKWLTTPSTIQQGHWCPKCGQKILSEYRKTYTLKDMQNIAQSRNGECLSNLYINSNTHLKFKCNKDGHIWMITPKNLIKGTWCPKCNINKRKKTIFDMRKMAEKNNGVCLSAKYIDNNTKLKWKCNHDGNIWKASPRSIWLGTWCPICSTLKTELLCKKYLEKRTQCDFIKCRMKKINGLELDGYCKKLNLAFEYNGIQHYAFTPWFHENKQQFTSQQNRDRLKRKLCKQNNIKLIEIPYKYNYRNTKHLYQYLDNKLDIINK